MSKKDIFIVKVPVKMDKSKDYIKLLEIHLQQKMSEYHVIVVEDFVENYTFELIPTCKNIIGISPQGPLYI